MSISNKALLVSLNISQWVGRKLDRKATDTVEKTHTTEARVGNYTKKLLPGAEELDAIQRNAGNIRVFFYEQTLPWCADGSRIISSKNYMDFVAEFRNKKSQFDKAVDTFILQYPRLQEEAKKKLGDLYCETEYPTVEYLTEAFNCDITFMPLPDVGDFRVELSEQEKKTFIDSMVKVERDAMKECWNRMHDVVSKAALKLNDPDAIIRESLIQNIQEMCQLMPKLNVTDDPQLEAMRQDVEKVANTISTQAVREFGTARHEAADKLMAITSKMAGFM